MNKAESFLNNPDKYLPPMITTKQILETYGALFQPIYIGTEDYFIEKKMKNTQSLWRFIITPSGPVAVSSVRKNSIWDIDFESEKDESFLPILDITMENCKDNDIQNLVTKIIREDDTYYLRMLPYDDERSSEILLSELDSKMENLDCR